MPAMQWLDSVWLEQSSLTNRLIVQKTLAQVAPRAFLFVESVVSRNVEILLLIYKLRYLDWPTPGDG